MNDPTDFEVNLGSGLETNMSEESGMMTDSPMAFTMDYTQQSQYMVGDDNDPGSTVTPPGL